jgi:NTP pyrophosphatase (non-canonical NTP hydrolase)
MSWSDNGIEMSKTIEIIDAESKRAAEAGNKSIAALIEANSWPPGWDGRDIAAFKKLLAKTPVGYNAGVDPRSFGKLHAVFDHLRRTSNMSTWSPTDRLAKAMEELGEVSTAVMILTGKLKHKKLDEPLVGEVADVMICLLDVLFSMHKDESNEELEEMLVQALFRKSGKWRELAI